MTIPTIAFDLTKLAALTPDELHTFHHHLKHLPDVLDKSLELTRDDDGLVRPEDGDIVIDCGFCCGPDSDAWFQANYGPVWQAAKFFQCGWPGLDCSCGNGGS